MEKVVSLQKFSRMNRSTHSDRTSHINSGDAFLTDTWANNGFPHSLSAPQPNSRYFWVPPRMSFYLKGIGGVCFWGILSSNHLRIEDDRLHSTLFSLSLSLSFADSRLNHRFSGPYLRVDVYKTSQGKLYYCHSTLQSLVVQ